MQGLVILCRAGFAMGQVWYCSCNGEGKPEVRPLLLRQDAASGPEVMLLSSRQLQS